MTSFATHRLKFITLFVIISTSLFMVIICFKSNLRRYSEFEELVNLKQQKINHHLQKNNAWRNDQLAFQPLGDFYKSWQLHMAGNPDSILSDWDFLSNKLGLLIIHKEIITSKNLISPSQLQITLEGSASKVLNWLGQIEEKYPLVRMDIVKIFIAESNVQLEITAALPNF